MTKLYLLDPTQRFLGYYIGSQNDFFQKAKHFAFGVLIRHFWANIGNLPPKCTHNEWQYLVVLVTFEGSA